MKIDTLFQDEKLIFVCKGKIKNQQNLSSIKKTIFTHIKKHSSLQSLVFVFETFPIDLSMLGLLLTLSNTKGYNVEILISNYSNYRMLEDLHLLQKFNVKYQKES